MATMFPAVSRRGFLAASAAAWMSGGLRLHAADAVSGKPGADIVVHGKEAAMKVVETSPIVLETPLSRLTTERITPVSALFVRNNQDLAGTNSIEAPPGAAEWTLTVEEDDERSRKITVEELRKLPQTTVEMVLQCSGNSRYRFAETVPVEGTPWGDGGVGNVEFGGVRLSTLLQHLKLNVPSTVRYLLAQGADKPKPGKQDFEHSLPIDECLGRSIVALTLNGQPLPAIHGGPLRLVTPGYFGTMHLKWLTKLTLSQDESNNDNHGSRYRMPLSVLKPGTSYAYTRANSRAGWKMNIKSLILLDAQTKFAAGREMALSGIAFNDGACPLETVLISLDRGASWKPVPLEVGSSPYAWSRWSTKLTLAAGRHEIWSRAIDELGRAQPLDGRQIWNPAGYEFNAVDRKVFEVMG
jgi:sulfite oxidase